MIIPVLFRIGIRCASIFLLVSYVLSDVLGQIYLQTEDYKVVGEDTLRLTILRDSTTTDQRNPVILFFFGGGWVGGNIGQFRPHAEYFAGRGMTAVLADYRTRAKHGTSPFDAVADAKSAIRFLRKNAQHLAIDPDRICAAGGSAGGHLAAAAATVPGLDDASDDLTISCKPNVLVLFNPVYDNGPNGYGYERILDRYGEISPMHNLVRGVPPTIVFFGTEDPLVPVETAEAYLQRMRALGNRCDLFLYPGQKHGFFNHKFEKYYRETVYQTDVFLQSLGYLTGPAGIVPEEVEHTELISNGHAHNDYRHERPLVDALQHGFVSVEADVLLEEGELYIGHDRHELDSMPSTLRGLYLEPLFRRFNLYNGAIFSENEVPFYLWIDIKYQGEQVYQILKDQLKPYREMLAWRRGLQVHPGAVQVIISGDRPISTMLKDSVGYMFIDGRPSDVGGDISAAHMPFVSTHYGQVFDLDAEGKMDDNGRQALRKIVRRVHGEGKKIRLWATPDHRDMWQDLTQAKVDLINVDDLKGLHTFLKNHGIK
ncbi:MAG: alpha/beta hydrolase fold domain-containing protein [Saprospiraceae bacterium]|nr:alpha/beta hydrolase fold domain-containing protein [Saprospiraceae bacterium]